MLFFAVFCGFLAEYQLEHKIEKEKGMQYIRSFYEDLKTDTADLSECIKIYELKQSVFKKRYECFDSMPIQLKSFNPCIVDFVNQASAFPDLVTEDRTMLQLKNAGGLRLLKKADADSILAYDRMIRIYTKSETTGLQELQYRIRGMIREMINYRNITLRGEDPSVSFLNTTDMKVINQFFVTIDEYGFACEGMRRSLKAIRKKAVGLLTHFKNKYKLE